MSGMKLQVGIKSLKQGTQLNQIEVPQALRNRRKVEITWFDDALGGEGFVPSTVMMLTGTPGAGKTTLMLQLADSIVKAGHVCLYNTGEESLYQVKMVAERLGLKNSFYVGQDTDVSKVLEHADKLREENPGKQVFLLQDSLNTLDDGRWADGPNSMTAVRAVEMLTDWAKTHFGIVIFIGQVTKDGKKFVGKNTILHAVDVRAHLGIDDEKRSETYGERIFEISKNRFGCSGKAYILGIEKTGLYEKGSLSIG